MTCVGDERAFSYLPSRNGATLADRVALNILRDEHPEFRPLLVPGPGQRRAPVLQPREWIFPWCRSCARSTGSIPSTTRRWTISTLVTPAGLQGGFEVLRDCLELLERNRVYRATCLGEPQLGRRGLYPTVGTGDSHREVSDMMDLLAYADGTNDLIDISDTIGVPARRLYPVLMS